MNEVKPDHPALWFCNSYDINLYLATFWLTSAAVIFLVDFLKTIQNVHLCRPKAIFLCVLYVFYWTVHFFDVQKHPECKFWTCFFFTYGVHTSLSPTNTSVCTHSWERIGMKCQSKSCPRLFFFNSSIPIYVRIGVM